MPELVPFHSYRKMLKTGVTEIIWANFMNVVLFYPAGLLIASQFPESWPHWSQLLFVGILFTLFSLGIEYAQFYWALGEPEIDDVIHNVLGALIGGAVCDWGSLIVQSAVES